MTRETHETSPVRRLPGGAIDSAYYIERGLRARSEIAHQALRAPLRILPAIRAAFRPRTARPTRVAAE